MARIVSYSSGFQVKASIYPQKSPILRRNGWKVEVLRRYGNGPTWSTFSYSGGPVGWFRTYNKAHKAVCRYLDICERKIAKEPRFLEIGTRLFATMAPDIKATVPAAIKSVPLSDLKAASETTGYGKAGLPAEYRDRPLLPKPYLPEHVAQAIAAALGA